MSVDDVKGVYFERKNISAGTMGTSRVGSEAQDLHYYLKPDGKGEINVYYLKPDATPTAIVMETISFEEFSSRFSECSTHDCDFKPKTEEEKKKELADKKVSVAESHLEKKEYNAAAFEFGQAIKVNDKNLEAHLGKGKAHMELGEFDKAKESFQNLAKIDDLYEKENKHLFNEYGIELRKGGIYDLAIENYQKAISIDPEDEALYYNIARALHASGEIAHAVKHLQKALTIKKDFKEAKALLSSMQRG